MLAVLASPPLATTGDRTRARLRLAANLLSYDQIEIVNLIDTATASVIEISTVGADADPWLRARTSIEDAIHRADAVLLGWGQSQPGGSARRHHRRQIEWLGAHVRARAVPAWTVGGTPRHPSRWQRYTHRAFPGVEFGEALRQALRPPT